MFLFFCTITELVIIITKYKHNRIWMKLIQNSSIKKSHLSRGYNNKHIVFFNLRKALNKIQWSYWTTPSVHQALLCSSLSCFPGGAALRHMETMKLWFLWDSQSSPSLRTRCIIFTWLCCVLWFYSVWTLFSNDT